MELHKQNRGLGITIAGLVKTDTGGMVNPLPMETVASFPVSPLQFLRRTASDAKTGAERLGMRLWKLYAEVLKQSWLGMHVQLQSPFIYMKIEF